jgi:molecular chaperone DnaK
MSQQSIRYGIDLGTTNSNIAILRGDEVFVVPSRHDMRITPSAVAFVVKNGQLTRADVGQTARQQLKVNPRMVAQQFKKQMGETGWRFPVAGVEAAESACDLSARVLRELVDSLKRHADLPPLHGAVITVPAIFQNPAREDTLRAGEAAGIGHVQLLPEPEAAALAFGQRAGTAGNPVWLVYDLGGGTFDAAIVRGEDGVFTKVDTDGDRNLGGSDLDAAIVRDLILPQLPEAVRRAAQPGANGWPSEVRWQLALLAEEAKVKLDVDEEVSEEGEFAGIDCQFTLRRADVEALQRRLFARTLAICHRLLGRSGYRPQQIDRVVLVGGPTRSPFLRRMLEHGLPEAAGAPPLAGLGIALDGSVDPMTAVARGAALFAASQRLPEEALATRRPAAPAGGVTVQMSTPAQVLPDDTDVIVAGRGVAAGERWSVVIERLEGQAVGWHSEPIALKANGGFTRRVSLQRGQNRFQVRIFDERRQAVPCDATAQFEIVRGIQVGELTLEQGLGIADVRGRTEWFFRKGDPLPSGPTTLVFKTTVALAKQASQEIIVPLVEGSEERANLNTEVYRLRIAYTAGYRDIPAGAEVHITLSVDRNRMISMSAALPGHELPIPPGHTIMASSRAVGDIRAKLDLVKGNLPLFKEVRAQSRAVSQVLAEIEEGEYVAEVEALLDEGSPEQPQAWAKAHDLVLDMLKAQQPHLDEVDRLISWDKVQTKCDRNVRVMKELVAETDGLSASWKREFDELVKRYQAAVARKDRKEASGLAFGQLPRHVCTVESLKQYLNDGVVDPLQGVDDQETRKPAPVKGEIERK